MDKRCFWFLCIVILAVFLARSTMAGAVVFDPSVYYDIGANPYSVAIGDLNGDGSPDLAAANYASEDISILLNNGDGTFQDAEVYWVGKSPDTVVTGDLDGDGHQDLAITRALSNEVAVLLGAGDGSFLSPLAYGVGPEPRSVAMGDLDGDSHPDLAVGNLVGGSISVLLQATTPGLLVTGPGPGEANSPLVRGFQPVENSSVEFEFMAYGATQYGVKVSSGDPDGDGTDELLTGAGPGEIYGPHVRGFEVDGSPLPGLNFLAYGTNKFGVNVCAGDLDGDGNDEIITGAGPGAVFGPHVRGWIYNGPSSVTPYPGVSYFAYGTPKWGVNVAAGDIDGDGYDEIVTGPGPGAVYGPHVRGWNVDGNPSASAIPAVSYFAYGTLKYGAIVSCGDVDGDGIDEIITGAGPGAVFGPHVRGWNHDGSSVTPLPGFSFFAWDTEPLRYGVNVCAGADLDGDGRNELVVGRGPDPEADTEVKVFTYDGASVNRWLALEAFPGYFHGANVAAGRF